MTFFFSSSQETNTSWTKGTCVWKVKVECKERKRQMKMSFDCTFAGIFYQRKIRNVSFVKNDRLSYKICKLERCSKVVSCTFCNLFCWRCLKRKLFTLSLKQRTFDGHYPKLFCSLTSFSLLFCCPFNTCKKFFHRCTHSIERDRSPWKASCCIWLIWFEDNILQSRRRWENNACKEFFSVVVNQCEFLKQNCCILFAGLTASLSLSKAWTS